MMKPVRFTNATIQPRFFCRLQQAMGPNYVSFDECIWSIDRTVYMTFGGEMNYGVNFVVSQQLVYQVCILDITMDERHSS